MQFNCLQLFIKAKLFIVLLSYQQIRSFIMFTPKNFKMLALATNLAWYSGVVPFHFKKTVDPPGDHEVICSPTKTRTWLVRVTFFLNTFYIFFILFRIFEKVFISDEEASLGFLVKMGYIFSAYSLPVVLQINTFLHWQETAQFIRQYTNFFKSIQG